MANIGYQNILNTIKETAAANTAQSQKFAREQMAFNKEEAQLTREWQEKMANSAHQREVKDLLAAGLNPILSANNGASVPSGATATGASGKVDESFSGALTAYLGSLISSATAINTANISAAASMYGSNTAAAASKYAANTSAAANKYSVDHSKYGAIINSSNSVKDILNDITSKFTGINHKDVLASINAYNKKKKNTKHK